MVPEQGSCLSSVYRVATVYVRYCVKDFLWIISFNTHKKGNYPFFFSHSSGCGGVFLCEHICVWRCSKGIELDLGSLPLSIATLFSEKGFLSWLQRTDMASLASKPPLEICCVWLLNTGNVGRQHCPSSIYWVQGIQISDRTFTMCINALTPESPSPA